MPKKPVRFNAPLSKPKGSSKPIDMGRINPKRSAPIKAPRTSEDSSSPPVKSDMRGIPQEMDAGFAGPRGNPLERAQKVQKGTQVAKKKHPMMDDGMGMEMEMMPPAKRKSKEDAAIDKKLVMFNTRKGMMHKGAKEDAKNWNDAAPQMESANARRPMVIEQKPSGQIMGHSTSAKPTSSRGAGMRKGDMAMGKRKGKSSDDVSTGKPSAAELKQIKQFDPGLYEELTMKGARAGSLKKAAPSGYKNDKYMFGNPNRPVPAPKPGRISRPMDMGKVAKGATCPNCGNKMTKGMCKCMGKVAKAYTPAIPVMPKPKPAPMMARPPMPRPSPMMPTAKMSKRKSGK